MPEPVKTTEPIELKSEDSLGDETISDLLNPPSLVEESTSGAEKSSDVDKSKGFTVEDVERIVAKAREKDEERFGELEQTITYFKGRLAERDESRQPEIKKEDEIGEFTYDETKLAEGMAENAPRTLAKLVDDLGKHIEKKLRKELGQDVDGRIANTERRKAINDAFLRDKGSVEEEYKEYLSDKDFQKEADAEMAGIISARGGKSWQDYLPGDLMSAASRVALRWMKSGKIKASTNGNSAETKTETTPSLREIVRRTPLSDSIGNGNGHAAGGIPKTIDQLFTSEKDRKIAKKVISKMGVSEEAYVKNYLRAREEDSDFDRAN